MYTTAREDVVFIRKNVTLEQLFNISFLAAFVGLLGARAGSLLVSGKTTYFSSLKFFLFPLYPGLSLLFGILVACIFVFFYARRRRMPTGRLLDFLSFAMMAAVPLGFFGGIALDKTVNIFEHVYLPIIYIVIFLIFLVGIYPKLLKSELKSGSLAAFFFMLISFVTVMSHVSSGTKTILSLLTPEDVASLILFTLSVIFLIKQEVFEGKGRR